MKAGSKYECFVQDVYSALNKSNNITTKIEMNKILIGTSGAKHEIDLYWEFDHKGKSYKTAIECKDYNRTIYKGLVSEFQGKLIDLPGLNGIMATKIGYQKGSMTYANFYEIDAVLVKVPTRGDFDENTILNIQIELNIIIPSYTNFDFEWDFEWLRKKYEIGHRFNLSGDCNSVQINDLGRKFLGTLNEFIRISEISTSCVEQTNDNDKCVVIEFDEAFLFDSLTNEEYKIKAMVFDYSQALSKSHIDVDALATAEAIIKRVRDGKIIFIKKS